MHVCTPQLQRLVLTKPVTVAMLGSIQIAIAEPHNVVETWCHTTVKSMEPCGAGRAAARDVLVRSRLRSAQAEQALWAVFIWYISEF